MRRGLHGLGFRFRLGGRRLPGKPDIVLAKYHTVIFVHGCFWHRHRGCKVATTPKSNTEFWLEKFKRNVARDDRVVNELKLLGWRVLIVWECELSSPSKIASVAKEVGQRLRDVPHLAISQHRDDLG